MTPSVLLFTAVVLSTLVAAFMVGLANGQRWLGLSLSEHSPIPNVTQESGLWIVDVEGPAERAGIPATAARVVALATPDFYDDVQRLDLEPRDLIEEPDVLDSYAEMAAFFARQERISGMIRGFVDVELATEGLETHQSYRINTDPQRPVASLPWALWMQIGVGLAGFWIGTWIWVLRRREWATRFLALSGLGLMTSAFPAAVYSTRELALPGDLFWTLSAFNSIGARIFGVGMIGLFLVYPRRLVPDRFLLIPALGFGLWQAADLLEWVDDPALGRHMPIVVAMLAIVALVAWQYRVTRGNPRDRAALTWLGLAVIVGAGAFVATVILPVVLGIGALVSQGQAFLFFLLIYVGVSLGVARYRLFQLDEWAFRILFYVVGVLLLLALDAALIVTIVDERAPAFALSLAIVALTWLPLRDVLARRLLRRQEPLHGALFQQVMDVVLSPPGTDQQARWRAVLERTFRPLSLRAVDGIRKPALLDDGLALVVPGAADLPAFRLDFGSQGRKLFTRSDLDLAGELSAMLANAVESRAAYEKGVAEERLRIARDIHDNIGIQLMGALHSKEPARKDLMIRETLTDLRDIVNNASSPDLSLDEFLADLRSQICENVCAAGLEVDWQAQGQDLTVLPLTSAQTLRSVVRESVQNALKHARAGKVTIAIRQQERRIEVTVADDGAGFDPEARQSGNGLANMRARITSLGGRFTLQSGPGGTRIEACFPAETIRKAP